MAKKEDELEIKGPDNKKPKSPSEYEPAITETRPKEEPKPQPIVLPQPKPVLSTSKVTNTTELERSLVSYVDSITKEKDAAKLGKIQISFFNLLRKSLGKPTGEFRTDWNLILKIARNNANGAFSELELFKGASGWTGSENEYMIFRRLCFIITLTMHPNTRTKNIESVNLNMVVNGLTQQERTNLLNFYG